MDTDALQPLLDDLRARHGIVGASVAVLAGGEVTAAATGVLNLRTGVPVTTDSAFQIGSVTKVYTTTLLMQLVDEGRLDLEAPVTEVRSGVRVGPAGSTGAQRLCHPRGVDGDWVGPLPTDLWGRGDDAIERYVAGLGELTQLHAPGATMSYCNSGFVVAGRIVEVLTGTTFAEALRDRIIGPLGVRSTAGTTEEAILLSTAVGHLALDPADPQPQVAPYWSLPPAVAPAGALLGSSPSDVLAFAQAHVDGGSAIGLTEATAAAMQAWQVDVPQPNRLGVDGWGLGWFRLGWDGTRVLGHDGGTLGQAALLRVVPDAGVAFAASVNGGTNGAAFFDDLTAALAKEVAGLDVPGRPTALEGDDGLPPLAHFEGAYEQPHLAFRIRLDGDRLVGDVDPKGPGALVAGLPALTDAPLTRVGPAAFTVDVGPAPALLAFYDPDGAEVPSFVHVGVRTFARVA